jgi:hypothetical protein
MTKPVPDSLHACEIEPDFEFAREAEYIRSQRFLQESPGCAMSFEISIFHSKVKFEVLRGLSLDGFVHPEIESSDMKRLIERLGLYGYEAEGSPPNDQDPPVPAEYQRQVGSCPITVLIFPTQVSFSVPHWKDSEDAICEAIQDASELADSATLALFDPQLGKWNDT